MSLEKLAFALSAFLKKGSIEEFVGKFRWEEGKEQGEGD
jgi:hypothetical protein